MFNFFCDIYNTDFFVRSIDLYGSKAYFLTLCHFVN